jgi:heme exporter protein D
MTAPADATRAGLIPIVVGVTGHRDLRDSDLASLEAAVRRLLERLQRDYPNSPLVMVTPLAEGADRLAARVALNAGAELVTPIPLPRADYVKDFPATVAEFDRLFEHAGTVRRVELPPIASPPAARDASASDGRDLQYALAGAYVARQSHFLIALWDGADSDSVGGTAQVVAFRRTGRFGAADSVGEQLELAPDPFALSSTPLDPHDTGPVYHIATPRKDRPSPDNPFSGRWLGPEHAPEPPEGDAVPPPLADRLKHIDAFNADALRLIARDEGRLVSAEAQLFAGPLAGARQSLAGLRRSFAASDALASGFQRETYRVMWAVYGLAMLAVVSFQLYAHAFPKDDPRVVLFLAGYVAVLGAADIVYLVSRHRQSQNKFQDYRAVAEGLRVQFYWRLAGLDRSAADYYLRKQRDELAWIREAIRAAGIRAAPASDGDLRALESGWIGSQRDYYTRSTRRERNRLSKYRAVAGGVILASLLWAIPNVALNLRQVPEGRFDWTRLLQLPLLVVSLVLAWHLAFKGSEVMRGARSRGIGAILTELRPFVLGAAGGGLFFVLVNVVARWAHTRWPEVESDRHAWSVVALTLVTVAGALIHSLTDKRAFGEHARQYARMAESFTRAGNRMAALLHDGKLERARMLAVELGKEALAEHGDWLMLHRERPIKLPKV